MHQMETIVIDLCSVCLSVCPSASLSQMHQMTPHGEADLRLRHCGGHSMQPLPNHCGLLFSFMPEMEMSWLVSVIFGILLLVCLSELVTVLPSTHEK